MINKNNDAYKTISEVAELLNLINPNTGKVSTHTLRFWEKEFKQIKPKIFAGNRRYYDINAIKILIDSEKKSNSYVIKSKKKFNLYKVVKKFNLKAEKKIKLFWLNKKVRNINNNIKLKRYLDGTKNLM